MSLAGQAPPKDGVGTAHSMGGRVWFTIGQGILTEVYYPTIDRPQMRDLEFLFSDGNGLFLEEKRDLDYQIERGRMGRPESPGAGKVVIERANDSGRSLLALKGAG